jgi:hypothetical protein
MPQPTLSRPRFETRSPVRAALAALLSRASRLAAAFAPAPTDPAIHWMSPRDLEELGLGRDERGHYHGRYSG